MANTFSSGCRLPRHQKRELTVNVRPPNPGEPDRNLKTPTVALGDLVKMDIPLGNAPSPDTKIVPQVQELDRLWQTLPKSLKQQWASQCQAELEALLLQADNSIPTPLKEGLSAHELAERLGVSPANILHTCQRLPHRFAEWTRSLDPGGLSWWSREMGDQLRYYPIRRDLG